MYIDGYKEERNCVWDGIELVLWVFNKFFDKGEGEIIMAEITEVHKFCEKGVIYSFMILRPTGDKALLEKEFLARHQKPVQLVSYASSLPVNYTAKERITTLLLKLGGFYMDTPSLS